MKKNKTENKQEYWNRVQPLIPEEELKNHTLDITTDKNKLIKEIFTNGGRDEIIKNSTEQVKKLGFLHRLKVVLGMK